MTQRTTSPAARPARAAALLAGLAACGSALAQDAPPANELRAGAYFVSYRTKADDLSGPFTPAGINIRVGDVTTPYFAYLRHIDAHWSVELAGGIPPTTKTYGKGPATVGSVPFDGQEVATAKWFSPSLLLEYAFLDPSSPVRPYVGAGLNYTRFYRLRSTAAGDAANGGPTTVKLTSSVGPAVTAGAAWWVTKQVDIVASYSAARVNSHYTSDTSGVQRETHIHFNPRTWVVSVGYAF
jgi:outer membrane protein